MEVRAAMDSREAIAVLDNEPDVSLVLLDLALPGTRGLDFLGDLKLDYPGVPSSCFSATHDRATIMAALGAARTASFRRRPTARCCSTRYAACSRGA
jgi:CheY-like chemotaxis protein